MSNAVLSKSSQHKGPAVSGAVGRRRRPCRMVRLVVLVGASGAFVTPPGCCRCRSRSGSWPRSSCS